MRTDIFPEVGDWITMQYARSTMAWGEIVGITDRGIRLEAHSLGGTPVPVGSPSADLLIPWHAIDYIQRAERGGG